MPTRLYFHFTTNSTSGLPTAEQSSLTATHNFEAQTINRSMNTTIGTTLTTLSFTVTAAVTHTAYVTRFVSAPLYQTSIAANTWTYSFAARESSVNHNFPVNGTNQAVRVNCYVWRPSSSTKVGTILDGNTAATVDEGAGNVIRGSTVTFTGSSVAGMQNDDVIIFEVWFVYTSAATSGTDAFFYDGTTVTTTDGTVVSHASFIETPETLNFTPGAGGANIERAITDSPAITVSDSRIVSRNKIRTSAETITVSG